MVRVHVRPIFLLDDEGIHVDFEIWSFPGVELIIHASEETLEESVNNSVDKYEKQNYKFRRRKS